jgi:hypothetical protein
MFQHPANGNPFMSEGLPVMGAGAEVRGEGVGVEEVEGEEEGVLDTGSLETEPVLTNPSTT